MKKILSLAFLLWIIQLPVAFAGGELKGTISGYVMDANTGLPIAGVSVIISDVKAGVNTDEKGFYQLHNIAEGPHLVEVSHIGYATIAENVLVQADTKKDFRLSATIIENNAVVVTGVTKATQLKKMPFQVSVMKKEDLVRNASTNIIEALAKKPGVTSISTGPAISKPLIRGLGYNRVLTINDGVRQEGQQWGDEHGIEIDESSVNKVEILKGPASLIYGSDAMAGVINIITNVPLPLNTMKFNLGTNLQSNNRLRAFNGNWGGNRNGFSWNVYGATKAAADFKNKYDGYVFNSKFNEHNMGGYVGYNGNWGFSHLLASNFDLKSGMVEGERDAAGHFVKAVAGGTVTPATNDDFTSTTPEIPYQHIRHFKIASDNNFKLGSNRVSINAGWQQNRRQEYGDPDAPAVNALYFDLQTFTYTAQLHLKEFNDWRTSIGFNGMSQHNTNKGVEQLIPDYRMQDMGAYFFGQREFNKISLSGGARYDNRSMNVTDLKDGTTTKSPGFHNNYGNFSASIGSAIEAGKHLNIKLNLARAFRAPSIPELASNGAHEGTIRYEYGDPHLKSETSWQTDAGIEYNNEHFSLNVAGYYNSFSNFIFYKKLTAMAGGDSTVDVNGTSLAAFKFDQRAAHLAGMELSLDIHPHPLDWLHVQNTFSLVEGRFGSAIEGSKNLPFIPAPKLLTELRGDFKKLGSLRNFYVKLEMDNNFKQDKPFTAYNTETSTPAYTLFNAGIGTDVMNKKSKLLFSINLAATNFTDVAYQSHLSRLKYAAENMATGRRGVYNMGRNFSIKLNVPLEIMLKK